MFSAAGTLRLLAFAAAVMVAVFVVGYLVILGVTRLAMWVLGDDADDDWQPRHAGGHSPWGDEQ